MDYKQTQMGRMAVRKYGDILNASRPVPSGRHPRMPVASRAKVFSPFAALRGFDDEIAGEGAKRNRVPRRVLSEEEAERLSDLLLQVQKGMEITVRYVKEEPDSPAFGNYLEQTGTVVKIDPVFRKLTLRFDGMERTIPFDDLDEIFGDEIVDIDVYLGIEGVEEE